MITQMTPVDGDAGNGLVLGDARYFASGSFVSFLCLVYDGGMMEGY